MKDVIIIDSTLPAIGHSLEYLFKAVNSGETPIEMIFSKIKDLSFEKIVLLPREEDEVKDRIKEFCKEKKVSHWTAKEKTGNNADLYRNINQLVNEKSIENIILCYIDSPLIDMTMLDRLYRAHKDNLAEYTFGDNFAGGLVPEILSREFIRKISEHQYKKPDVLSRNVFDCIDADINKFFIEVEIAEVDLSLLRVEFTASNLRNFILLENLLKHTDKSDGYKKYYEAIQKNPEILFIAPKYIEIEITNETNISSIIKPASAGKMTRRIKKMDLSLYKKIIDQVSDPWNDIIISYSLMGEPLLHPDILKFLDYAIEDNKIFTVIIETNGINLDQELIKKLSAYPAEKLVLLFHLDSIIRETYYKLNKTDDKDALDKTVKNINEFINYNEYNRLRSFVQITKIKENNLEIEDFYNFWQSKGVQVVIQKYNGYLGALEDRSVVDITPLDRVPCWHLQRDLEILVNGDVPVCKQDFDGKIIVGNLGKDPVKGIWDKIKKFYLYNYKAEYNKLKICSSCDEWYTYNF
ncbi:MAG: spiro-SPASM protein [Spirochaetes bacterium]|nr:spiro-SPASM protein [Spirochaetota bacterium]